MEQRVRKFWYEISQRKLTVPSAAVILGITSLISNILGLVREGLIGGRFDRSVTDIFYASFKLPDLIFNLLVLGAVSSAFIPVFVGYLSEKKREEANQIASNFMNFLLLGTILLGVIVFVAAPKLVPFLLPGFFNSGFTANFNVFDTTVMATRIMILSPVFFAISSVLGGILNSRKRFLSYALAPIIYNVSIIAGIVFLAPKTQPPVFGLLYGVILGAALHALIQLPAVLNSGFRWRPILRFREFELPKIVKLMIPRTIAIGVNQINLLVDTIVASFFVGGITHLTFANDIQTLPTVVFAISIATAVFPIMAEFSTNGERANFLKVFSESARKILYFMIPATIGLIVVRAQVVRLAFGVFGDKFTWADTSTIILTLSFFAIGLVAQGLAPLLVRAFYALRDTKTPLTVGIWVMILNVVLSVTLPFIKPLGLGVAGIALAFSVSGYVNAAMLLYYLHKKIGALDRDNKIFASTARLAFSALLMGFAAYASLYLFDIFVDTHTVIGLLTQTVGAVLVGALTYFGLTYLFECEETGIIFKKAI